MSEPQSELQSKQPSSRAGARRKQSVKEARSALYRQLVFEAAEGAFAERGVEETKMEEIAAEAGISLGTLYSVFSGKAELVAAIHEMRLRDILARTIDAARLAESPLDALLLGVRSYVEFFSLHPDYLKMHLREGYAWGILGKAAPTRTQADAWNEGVARQKTLFERGIADGLFHPLDPTLMARMTIAMQQVQLAAWVESGMTQDPEQLIEEMESQLRRSFCLCTDQRAETGEGQAG